MLQSLSQRSRRSCEAYVISMLNATDEAAFERHLLACSRCIAVIESADRYVRAMREVERQLLKGQCSPRIRP